MIKLTVVHKKHETGILDSLVLNQHGGHTEEFWCLKKHGVYVCSNIELNKMMLYRVHFIITYLGELDNTTYTHKIYKEAVSFILTDNDARLIMLTRERDKMTTIIGRMLIQKKNLNDIREMITAKINFDRL